MEWKMEARPGVEIYISDSGSVVIKNTEAAEGEWVIIHPADVELLIDRLAQVKDWVAQHDNPLLTHAR